MSRTESVRVLLEHGAAIDAANGKNETALMLASWCGNLEIVRILLDAGADPTVRNYKNKTALLIAKEHGHSQVVSFLECATEKYQLLRSISSEVSETQPADLHF